MAGAATGVGALAVAAVLAAGMATVGAASLRAVRAAGVADAAALAAADAASGAVTGVPCDRAAAVATATGATVLSCELDGLVATVRVQVGAGPFAAQGRARAGPATGPEGAGSEPDG